MFINFYLSETKYLKATGLIKTLNISVEKGLNHIVTINYYQIGHIAQLKLKTVVTGRVKQCIGQEHGLVYAQSADWQDD